jgi:hypothetical protein
MYSFSAILKGLKHGRFPSWIQPLQGCADAQRTQGRPYRANPGLYDYNPFRVAGQGTDQAFFSAHIQFALGVFREMPLTHVDFEMTEAQIGLVDAAADHDLGIHR